MTTYNSTYNNTVKSVEKTDSLYRLTAYCKKQQFWHLQLNIVTRKHRCIVHFSDSVIDVGLIVRIGVAGWRGGTTAPRTFAPGSKNPHATTD